MTKRCLVHTWLGFVCSKCGITKRQFILEKLKTYEGEHDDMVRPIDKVLDSIYCCTKELDIIIQEYERFLTNLGLKPLAEMGISEKVKVAEFIKLIRSEHGEGQKTSNEEKTSEEKTFQEEGSN